MKKTAGADSYKEERQAKLNPNLKKQKKGSGRAHKKPRQRMPGLICYVSFLFLLVLLWNMSPAMLVWLGLIAAAGALFCLLRLKKKVPLEISFIPIALTVLLLSAIIAWKMFVMPYGHWQFDFKNVDWFLLIINAALALGSIPFFLALWALIFKRRDPLRKPESKSDGVCFSQNVFALAVVFACVSICVTFNSTSSPLYAVNSSYDPNCFFTVGKALAQGKVLYVDIYEQKGPVLYALHSLAWMFDQYGFLGVYILEILSGTLFFWLMLKCADLFAPGKWNLIFIPLAAAAFYLGGSFAYGDNAEEFCMPALAFGFYTLLKALKTKTFPAGWRYFVCGICMAWILWIKYTVLGFYIGWFLAFLILIIVTHKWKQIFKMTGFSFAGAVFGSIPVGIYFFVHQAIPALFESYFYNNIFLYNRSAEAPSFSFDCFIEHGSLWIAANGLCALLILFALVYVCFEKWLIASCYLLCFFTTAFFSLASRVYFPYYPEVLGLFMALFPPFGFLLFGRKRFRFETALCSGISAAGTIALGFLAPDFSGNYYLSQIPADHFSQSVFASIMNQIENPTLYTDLLDGGYYTSSGIEPTLKYFCTLNLTTPEAAKQQQDMLENGTVDFIVSRRILNSPQYTEIALYEETLPEEKGLFEVRLYANNEIAEKLKVDEDQKRGSQVLPETL